tara:strand:- start:10237 stop:11169 length:933 start_codon:yes stop_codon:yes gene_type:complete
MFGTLTLIPVLGSIQTALDQPVFPGKLVLWLMFMLSIVSWVMIVSKILQLRKSIGSDQRFDKRLRESRTTLELFEEGWKSDSSPQYVIYLAGAKEAAFQLLGSREPRNGMQHLVQDAGTMSENQTLTLRQSFQSGLQGAQALLQTGMAGFRLIGASAGLLGLIGFVWTLMGGLDTAANLESAMPIVGSALGFLAVALMVATPAILARMSFAIHLRRRIAELQKFHDNLARLFERKFCDVERAIGDRLAAEKSPVSDSSGDDSGELEALEGGKKQYHSIRDRLLRPHSKPSGFDELQINPIARQAAAIRSL